MQNIVLEKPYHFVPPHRGNWWPTVIQRCRLIDAWLRTNHGVIRYECRHVDRLRDSLNAGHGILLTPNHSCVADPIVMGFPARDAGTHVFAMASWHLFNQSSFTSYAIRKMGAFSVNREGIDRKAINTATEILTNAERPLILFPEGATTRTNDQLQSLLDGVAFIARTAVKKRARMIDGGKVVVHPVAIKYCFEGDLFEAIDPVLTNIERRLTSDPAHELPLLERVLKIGKGLLTLKEIQYFGKSQSGPLSSRCTALIDQLLQPIEREWLNGQREEDVIPRTRILRSAIVPEMTHDGITQSEWNRRRQQLEEIHLAPRVNGYCSDYLVSYPSVDRLRETVDRFEEDLTGKASPHAPQKVILEIGEAIEVTAHPERSRDSDELMNQIRKVLQSMMDRLAKESPQIQ